MMLSEADGFLGSYKSDLTNHDRSVLNAVEGEFCWFLRKDGTWIFMKNRDIGLIPSLDHLKTNLKMIKELKNIKAFHGVNIPGKYQLNVITIEQGIHMFRVWSKGWSKMKKIYQVINSDGTVRGESANKNKIWNIIGQSWAPYTVIEKDSGRLVEEFIPF